MNKVNNPTIRCLAKIYGVQTAYYDVFKQRRWVSAATLGAMLDAMGVSLASHQEALQKKCVEPVQIAWDGYLDHIPLYFPQELSSSKLSCQLIGEDGNIHEWDVALDKSPIFKEENLFGRIFITKILPMSKTLSLGYHQLKISLNSQDFFSLIIAAPRFGYSHRPQRKRSWGLFTPLYALNSARNFGAGDFTDFRQLIQWLSNKGGDLVGTLPLFANFFANPYEPSPYSPVSRLFFNEFYLDVEQIPELSQSTKAQNLLNSMALQKELQVLREAPLVNYPKIMTIKRRILELLSDEFFANGVEERKLAFQTFIASNPLMENYASFRAVQESLQTAWHHWPQILKLGEICSDDYDPKVKEYYLYSQWQVQEQLSRIRQEARLQQVKLYLDMPLGVHADGYDTWRESNLFAQSLTVGAPPDAVFVQGQNWSFPPIIPHIQREQHYHYFINYLRQTLAYVDLLRIDHVMGLHRLYCIPQGFSVAEGAFIRYPAEELYAILCLESVRHKACIVGENLGMVPQYVNTTMNKHHLYKMHVLQYEIDSDPAKVLKGIPRHSVASFNTHDMPPFAAYIKGLDLQDREKKGYMTAQQATKEYTHRQQIFQSLLSSKSKLWQLLSICLNILAKSRCQFLLINLEDLWLETRAQNIPASGMTYPNWQRKNRRKFSEWRNDRKLIKMLVHVAKLRQGELGK